MFYNLPETTPEIVRYELEDESGRFKLIVTDADLKSGFTDEDIRKLKSNRHTYYTLTRIYD
ncbi:hypothetical protein UGMREWDR_CDS0111 [Aeromonas phage GomatiRiver_11]|nr:hypothetical protein OBDJBBDK_00104 [Aeromonas phage AhFM11]WKW84278.1 hypothetical protein UGMREWDR_CDS0111 [Aeromonas phage GomatiRiver_11]